MIIETIVNILFIPIETLLGWFPDFSWTIGAATTSTLAQLFSVACYILPVGTIAHILTLIIAITAIRIVISMIKLILNALPFF